MSEPLDEQTRAAAGLAKKARGQGLLMGLGLGLGLWLLTLTVLAFVVASVLFGGFTALLEGFVDVLWGH